MKQKLLVTFAVVVSVLAVLLIADVVLAGDIFLPLITRGEANTTVGPSGALYVFSSSGTTTGDGGGRSGMNAICTQTDPASHFCTIDEIENAYQTKGVLFSPVFLKSWADDPDPANWASEWTCRGWTNGASTGLVAHGYVILADGSATEQSQSYYCDVSFHVACCKWIP